MPKLTGGATTAEHKIATREAMLDAFIRELHEQGWQNVKLQTVAQAAGVSRTAVYNYFPDKSALLLAWSTREMDRFLLLAERELADRENPVDRIEILVKLTLVEFSLQRFTGIALVELLSAQDRESFLEHIVPLSVLVEQLVQEGVDAGVFVDSDAAASAQLILACVESRRPMLMAGDRVDAVVATTVPFIMRALGVSWPTSLTADPTARPAHDR